MRKFLLKVRDLLRSIASLPAVFFFAFVLLAFYQLSTTDEPQRLPDWLARFNISDLDTVRTALSAVISGVFTLTVFAYTMVMSVLNRSISSYSPRLIPLLLAERYHQEILGVSAGTIAHSTILLLGVAEPPEFGRPPVLAAASAGLFAILSLILFIYFIHRVSQSIFINVLLRKSFEHTSLRLRKLNAIEARRHYRSDTEPPANPSVTIRAERCGYLHEVDYRGLLDSSEKIGAPITLHPRPGSFVYAGDVLLTYDGRASDRDRVEQCLSLSENEPIDVYANGFRHLVEVAIKAASPAINDPATSMTAVHYLGQLFQELVGIKPYNLMVGGNKDAAVLYLNDWQYDDLLTSCFDELRTYLSSDPWGRDVLQHTLHHIEHHCRTHDHTTGAQAARRQLTAL